MRLSDLPNRRVEAWKYTDLRAAVDEGMQFAIARDVANGAVEAARARGGVIGALAAQMDGVETLEVSAGHEVLRVDRPRYANLAPRLLDVSVAAGASLTRVVIQEARADAVFLDAIHVRLAAGSKFRQFVLAEGGKLSRIETHVLVEDEGAEVALNGVYVCGEGRHADLTSIIEHKAPGGQTRQLTKGVARRGGRGVFQGKIVVDRGAQKTDARQYHHGMLLEEGAEVFAKPELMIYADDVACAHGNTAGGLDETALFYMRSRGIPETQARALLIEAFLGEAVPDWMPPDLSLEITERIAAWLRGAP